jgi:hypothetical protein
MKRTLSVLCAASLVLAACGGDDDETGGDDTGAETAAPATEPADTATAETAAPPVSGGAAVDIDAMLAADLANCAEAPTGEPIKVGMAHGLRRGRPASPTSPARGSHGSPS